MSWTPGPWTIEWWSNELKPWQGEKGCLRAGDRRIIEDGYYCEDDGFNWTREDGELIALSPEMAAVILEAASWIEDAPRAFGDRWRERFLPLAERLRAISEPTDQAIDLTPHPE